MSEQPIWTPGAQRVAQTGMDVFRCSVKTSTGQAIADSRALHHRSVTEPGAFWQQLWEFCDVPGSPGAIALDAGQRFEDATFFPEGQIDVAAALLGQPSDAVAIVQANESGALTTLTRADLHRHVAGITSFLRERGVGPGDVVAAWTPNVAATVTTMIATIAVGATFTSSSADFGPQAVIDRFARVGPKVLLAADGYRYGGKTFECRPRLGEIVAGLPSVTDLIMVDHLGIGGPLRRGETGYDQIVAAGSATVQTSMRPFNDPGWILYSSGTTGQPKCIVHRLGGVLLKHLSEQRLHCDIRPGDVVQYYTTTGWMMWNWLVSALACDAAIVLYDGSPAFPDDRILFDVARRASTTYFGVSARYLDSLRRNGARPAEWLDGSTMRSIASTGSPLSIETARWVYDAVAEDIHLISKSGGTDLCGGLVTGDPTSAVIPGELQMPALGLQIEVVDDEGRPLGPGQIGELVCSTPFPSMPLRFVGDDGSLLHRTYYERFPGRWHQSDFASWTDSGGMVIHGRSDATLNANGVRIGTAEIYGQLSEMPELGDAVAVGQRWEGDTRVVLLVTLQPEAVLDDGLRDRIRTRLRTQCSPRHVPAVILASDDLPKTSNGKLMEILVADLINADPPRGLDSVANPDSISAVLEATLSVRD